MKRRTRFTCSNERLPTRASQSSRWLWRSSLSLARYFLSKVSSFGYYCYSLSKWFFIQTTSELAQLRPLAPAFADILQQICDRKLPRDYVAASGTPAPLVAVNLLRIIQKICSDDARWIFDVLLFPLKILTSYFLFKAVPAHFYWCFNLLCPLSTQTLRQPSVCFKPPIVKNLSN